MPANDQSWRFKGFAAPQGNVNAASRAIIPSPSGTNWNATFGANGGGPASPSNTNFAKTFAPTWARNNEPVGGGGQKSDVSGQSNGSFAFNLSPANDRSGLSLSTTDSQPSTFFHDRVANMDLTTRDHQMYGAGGDYGFNY